MLVDETLEDALQLPDALVHVQEYLHQHDPDLRLRRSVERPDSYVLERRCRRAPAVNTGMRIASDLHLQARDGYIHVALVHPEWLMHPWNIVIALRDEGFDTWAYRNADQVADEVDYEERWLAESRRRRRGEDYRGHLRETYDVLSRLGNPQDRTERSRFSNPGVPAAPAPERRGHDSHVSA